MNERPSWNKPRPGRAVGANLAMLALLAGLLSLVGSCRSQTPSSNAPHPRVVTFAPALSGMIYEMGLGDHIVGVTDIDASVGVIPPGFHPMAVGDNVRPSTEAILSLKPDVIVTQSDVQKFATVQQLEPGIAVEFFKIETVDELADAILRLGRILGREDVGRAVHDRFVAQISAVRARVAGLDCPRVLFVMGYQQPSSGGRGTFISEMVGLAGGANVADKFDGWTSLNLENILEMKPDVLICQVKPFERDGALKYWQGVTDVPAVRNGRIYIVTEDNWTIPTTRLPGLVDRLADIIHPPRPSTGKTP